MGAKFTSDGDLPGFGSAETDRQASAATIHTGDAGLDVVEVVGAIKWFDVAKGFGFIVPDDGRPDVLLHVTCLRRDGYQTAYEGARVVCEALARPGGLQAYMIVLPPKPRDQPTLSTHEGYEWTHVLSGRLRLVLGDRDLDLGPGETVEFDTRVPHWVGNTGTVPCEILALFGPQGERMHVR